METRVLQIDPLEDVRYIYQQAANLLAEGELVALPTETVYGLGADAFNAEAVARIFEVKERPSFDPLICHISRARDIYEIAEVPEALQDIVTELTMKFWPGAMTLVLPKKDCVPDVVTSGLPTVACRVSSNDVMRRVLRLLGSPIAAPSANIFGHISPTCAAAVVTELGGRIPLIVDGGACAEGLESTILEPCIDEKGNPAVRMLREGPVTREMLRPICRVIRPKKVSGRQKALLAAATDELKEAGEEPAPVAPGQLLCHYAPSKPLVLCAPRDKFELTEGLRYGLISYQGESKLAMQGCWDEMLVLSPGNGRMTEAAIRLFAMMRTMDENEEIDVIVVEELTEGGIGCAMMDRLRRASAGRAPKA